MSRIPLSDESAMPWDRDDSEKVCDKCGGPILDPQLVASEPELCEDCAPGYEDDEPDDPRAAWYPGSNLDEGPW